MASNMLILARSAKTQGKGEAVFFFLKNVKNPCPIHSPPFDHKRKCYLSPLPTSLALRTLLTKRSGVCRCIPQRQLEPHTCPEHAGDEAARRPRSSCREPLCLVPASRTFYGKRRCGAPACRWGAPLPNPTALLLSSVKGLETPRFLF